MISTEYIAKKGSDEKVLRLQNDGKSPELDNIGNEFPTLSTQFGADCFRIRKIINQLRWPCSPLYFSLLLKDDSDATYSSIGSLDSRKVDCEVLNAVSL